MYVLNLKHELGVSPHILLQILIRGIHKVPEFALRDVVEIPWNKFRLKTFLKELPCVAMVLPVLLSNRPPPCGGIAFQVGLGKLHGGIPSNLGGM